MQHITLPTDKILYGNVAALIDHTLNYNDAGVLAGLQLFQIVLPSAMIPAVLLETFVEIITAFNSSGSNLISLGSTAGGSDLMGTGVVTAGTIGFYPSGYARKRITVTTPVYLNLFTGTQQVETATATGTVTGAGNASVVITSSILPGSPVTYAVPVTTGAATVWGPQVVTFLQTQLALAALYTVSGTGASIILTAITPAANDSTLNIATATGTATGITTEATSANTTAGVAPSASTGQAKIYFKLTPLIPEPSL